MKNKRLVYPIIVSEYNDDGHYFVATSPNIPGMVTQGETLSEVAIATMIAGEDYPTPQDPTDWSLKQNERVIFVSVNMSQWLKRHSKTVRKNITIPDYLNDWAVENNVNVSRVTTEALMKLADI